MKITLNTSKTPNEIRLLKGSLTKKEVIIGIGFNEQFEILKLIFDIFSEHPTNK